MEYIITMMEGAVIEAITQHLDKIIKSFQVNISFEGLKKLCVTNK